MLSHSPSLQRLLSSPLELGGLEACLLHTLELFSGRFHPVALHRYPKRIILKAIKQHTLLQTTLGTPVHVYGTYVLQISGRA